MRAISLSHALQDNPLPGIDDARLSQLADAGLTSLEDVVAAGPGELARITGFSLDTSRALVRVAQGALAAVDPTLLEFVPPLEEAASKRLARGLKAARDIEALRSHARTLRDRIGRRPSRPQWRKSHKKARRQLQRLMTRLEGLQRDVLTDGLSRTGLQHLRGELEPISEEVQLQLAARPRKRLFKRIAKRAKGYRRHLTSS